MKYSFQLVLAIALLVIKCAVGQGIEFACDPNFRFYNPTHSELNIKRLDDTLDRIDFNRVDFELRVWNYASGQAGIVNQAFAMRHYKKHDVWKAFRYASDNGIFRSTELTAYKSKDWKKFWDTLAANGILTLQPPHPDTLSKMIGGGGIAISHDSFYIFELIQKDCKRSYRFSEGAAGVANFKDVPEFKRFNTLIALIAKRNE